MQVDAERSALDRENCALKGAGVSTGDVIYVGTGRLLHSDLFQSRLCNFARTKQAFPLL